MLLYQLQLSRVRQNNKKTPYAAIGAPGSTHDARMLKITQLYQDIIRGNVISNIRLHLEGLSSMQNSCIDHNKPCEPRWRLEVVQLGLVKRKLSWSENKQMFDLNRMKICNWLWKLMV